MNAWTDAANVLAEQPTNPTRQRDLTMRPTSILDPRFRYVPSSRTDVTVTWRRFGFNPQRNAEFAVAVADSWDRRGFGRCAQDFNSDLLNLQDLS